MHLGVDALEAEGAEVIHNFPEVVVDLEIEDGAATLDHFLRGDAAKTCRADQTARWMLRMSEVPIEVGGICPTAY
jgi:hypothetical protein